MKTDGQEKNALNQTDSISGISNEKLYVQSEPIATRTNLTVI